MLTTMDFDTVITTYPMKRGRKPIYSTDEDRKEAQRRYSRNYFYRNHETVSAKIREYKINNREEIREQSRSYYHSKKDREIS